MNTKANRLGPALAIAILMVSPSSAWSLLIYNTSVFGGQTSEALVIQPSGPEDGELVATNASNGTPIVDVDYVANLDIIVNDNDGFQNDVDSLTLAGTNPDTPATSGRETFDVDLDASGTVSDPVVEVRDGGTLLYRLRSQAGFSRVTLDGQGEADTFNVAPSSVAVHVEGGSPGGLGDVLNVVAGGAGYTLAISVHTGEGSFSVPGFATISFAGIEDLQVDGAPVTFKECKKQKTSVLGKKILPQFICTKS